LQHLEQILLWVLLLISAGLCVGGERQESYEYDPAGRLSRILAPDGSSTRFNYDSLGNLISVEVDESASPPFLTSISPSVLRAGETYRAEVLGRHLAEADVLPPTADFSVSELERGPEALSFTLSLSDSAPLGEQILRVVNSNGSASKSISVLPPLPGLTAGPLPLALPEDGSVRTILIGLTHADAVDRAVALWTKDPQIAEPLETEVTIPAGETESPVRIRGLSGGVTALGIQSDGLESAVYPVYVTAAYGAINTNYGDLVGLVVGDATPAPPAQQHAERSPALGVVLGASLRDIAPGAVYIGARNVPITIFGTGLDGVETISASPAEGLSITDPDVSPDGNALTAVISVTPDAPTVPRRLLLGGTEPAYPPASPGADLLGISLPPPEIHSVQPLFALPGDIGVELHVRGRFLDLASALRFEPNDGMTVSTELQTDLDGTRLTARFSVAANAEPGERLVRVVTPGGISSGAPSVANRLLIAEQAGEARTPVVSRALGIQVGTQAPEPDPVPRDARGMLGLTLGSVVSELAPDQGAIGNNVDIKLRGFGLSEVSSIAVDPPDGIVVKAVTSDPLGEFVLASLRIAPDAVREWRRLRVFAADTEIPFADAASNRFLVTAPLPEIASVSPNTLWVDAGPETILIRGTNLDRALAVRSEPQNGLAIGPPDVNADGTRLSLTVDADTDASAGPRVLRVTTPAGTSESRAHPGNTMVLHQEPRSSTGPLAAPQVGIRVGASWPAQTGDSLTGALLGVVVGSPAQQEPGARQSAAPILRVTRGTLVREVEAPYLIPGDTYTLRLLGHELQDVDGAAIFPGFDVALSKPAPSADGTEVLVSLTIPPGAAVKPRQLRLVAGADVVPFLEPADSMLHLSTGFPEIDSVQPIVAEPGNTVELIVRGSNLGGAVQAVAKPPVGLDFDTALEVSADGTELRTRLHVREDAPLGPRTIRVQTRGGTSTDAASPANTFTVY
jgi:YD repeat-containing protein